MPSKPPVPPGEADTIEAETQPKPSWIPGVGYVDDEDEASARPTERTVPANPAPASAATERTVRDPSAPNT